MSSKPPDFVLHHRKVVCENSQFDVFFDNISFGAKQHVDDYLVVSPKRKTDRLVSGVAVLPVLSAKLGLIKIYRHTIDVHSWEIPRGFLEDGEDPQAAAIRELREEAGLLCKPDDMLSMGCVAPEAGILAARIALFAAVRCEEAKSFTIDEFGHQALCFFSPSEFIGMATRSEIQDPCTLVAYYRWQDSRIF